jgi:hypothetical protein
MKVIHLLVLRPDQEPILAGRLNGKRAFLSALEALPALDQPTLVILDFSGAQLATSSYLAELVVPLRDHLRLRRPPGYVVVANLDDKVAEELDGLMTRTGEAILVCKTSPDGSISDAYLLGKLDHKLRETFDLIRTKGETTAVELHSESGDSRVGATAWNNRLTALTNKSLVMEIPQGRTKKYRAVLEIA